MTGNDLDSFPDEDEEAPERINPRSGTTDGRNRYGATDTTYLIWLVVREHPGITLDELFDLIEEKVPSGWAYRRWLKTTSGKLATRQQGQLTSSYQDQGIRRARRHVVTLALASLVKNGHASREGPPGAGGRPSGFRYTAVRPPAYRGNPDLIDLPGSTRAADHLRAAYALRDVEAFVRRMEGRANRDHRYIRDPEIAAVAELARAYRAKKCLECGGGLT